MVLGGRRADNVKSAIAPRPVGRENRDHFAR